MSLNRRTGGFHLAVCCLLWSSWSLLLADGNGRLGPAGSLSVNASWQLLKVSPRFGGFSPHPSFIEGQSPRRTAESDDTQHCSAAGTCSMSYTQTADTATTAGLQAPEAAAANTAGVTDSSPELQAQQPQQPLQELQSAAEQQQQQQQTLEPTSQQPQKLQQEPILQDGNQALLQQPEQLSHPAAEATLQQQPAAADPIQQQVLAIPSAVQTVPALAPAAAADTLAAVPVPASQQQQQQLILPPSPVRRLLNLAELSDGASVLAANPETKRPERAIDKDIDSFMKNDCNAHKWMMIELSQLGTVETVKLTMKELYSSRVHTFRVFGRSSHPRKDGPDLTASLASEAWQLLGAFTAENKRGTQAFSLPQRSRVRYLLLTFDTHYGSEAMCAMNWIEVLGVSAAQELEEALALQELEVDGDEHEQQLLFGAQQLELLNHQPPPQQVPVVQPSLQEQQQQQLVQQQAELPGEQQAAVLAAAVLDGTLGTAGSSLVQTGAGDSTEGMISSSTDQQSLPVDAAAIGQAGEQQQQHQHSSLSPATAQQLGAQPATMLEGGSSMQLQQDTPAGSADEVVPGGPAASTGQLASETATAGQPSLAAASGGATTAAALQQHLEGSGEHPTVAGDKAGTGGEVDVQQQQQQQQPPTPLPLADEGAAIGTAVGKQQQWQQPQVSGSSGSALDSSALDASTTSGALPADESRASSAVTPADHAADSSSNSVPAADSIVEQLLPVPAAAASVTGAQGAQAAASSTSAAAAAADQVQGSTPAAASSDAAAAAPGVPVAAASTGKPGVSAGVPEAATGAAVQPAAAVPAGNMHSVPSNGEPAASPAQSQQQLVTSAQHQHAVAQQQQPQPAAPQQRPQQKAQPREGASVLETWSSTAKPKQAGNLFDIIKSEMMQMKLEQSKAAKKLDGLAKRSTDFEAVAALLQQQQAQVLAQIANLTTKLEKVAEQQQQQAAAVRQHMAHHHHIPGPAGSAAPAGAGLSHHLHLNHPHLQSAGASTPQHGPGAGPGIPVCERRSHQVQLLLQPHFQWGIVTALFLTCVLGLCVLLHPRCALLPPWLRVAVCCLAVLNGMLAGLLSVWLLVVHSLQLGPAVVHLPADPLLVRLPTHRMLGSSAWDQL